jgi:hypothetical protein
MQSLRLYREKTAVLCALMLVGCIPETPLLPTDDPQQTQQTDQTQQNQQPDQVLAANAPRPPVQENESNDEYGHAQPVTLSEATEIRGSLGPSSTSIDQDFYALGPVSAGDTITGELEIDASDDIVMAIIDAQGSVLTCLDLYYSASGPGTVNLNIHQSTPQLYALMTSRSASTVVRSYRATIGVQRGGQVAPAIEQIIVLNFQGAQNVRIANRTGVNVPAFDASVIDPEYAGFTNVMINNVLELVRADYEGVGVHIYLAGQPGIPAGSRSTVYFGTFDNQLLGLADNVDPYNADLEQSAILYTDTFSVFRPLSPDVTAMSQALANVASHEIGHLLGLRHTTDPFDLMDVTASAQQLLNDQWFRWTYLNEQVLPIGLQDAPALLSWTVGGTLAEPPSGKTLAARQKAINVASRGLDFNIPRSQLSSCGGH